MIDGLIERRRLGLVEITQEEYILLKTKLNLKTPTPANGGFAKITKPLKYDSYEDALERFVQTPGARLAAIRIGWKNWKRVDTGNIDERRTDIKELAKLARQKGFLVLNFYGAGFVKGIDNEIAFEPDVSSKGVSSAHMCIPGDQRKLYNWQGSGRLYRQINGIYAPLTKRQRMYQLLVEMIRSAEDNDVDRVLELNQEYSELADQRLPRGLEIDYDNCRRYCVMSVKKLKHMHEKLVKDARERFSKIENPLLLNVLPE